MEARHIELLLDVIEDYESGSVLDISVIFDKLGGMDDIQQIAEEFPFEYGHEYRPALANILVAQRLQKLGVDSTLLNELIEISLRDVMAPEQAEQTVDEWGIRDIGLNERWMFNFPTHIVRRFQEIEADEVGARDNYADRGLGLLKLLEQALEFVADYYGQQEFGTNWKERFARNDEGRLSFGVLRDFLNTAAMERCLWVESVRDLLDEPLIGAENVIDARNILGHDRQSRLSKEDYLTIKERVTSVFARMNSELPILGEVESEHQLGAYILNLYWENVQKWCYLRTDGDLEMDTVYYLPPESIQGESVIQVGSGDVVECSSSRVVDNLSSYTEEE